MPHSPAPLGVGVQARVPGIDVIGGMHNSVEVDSADYSLTLDDGNPFVSVTTGNTDRTLDLPACSLDTVSVEFLIQKADSGTGDVILEGRSSTVTISSASPGIVTWTAHGMVDGLAIVFENSGGALPTGLTAGTTYYVVSAATDTFSVASAPGGTAINTSGGSGTHTAYETINGRARWYLYSQYEWIRVIAKAEGWAIAGVGMGTITDTIRAYSSAGLTLYDDGNNVGLFIKDGAAGRIGIGTATGETWDTSYHAILETADEAIAFGDSAGGYRLEFLVNMYFDSSGQVWKTKNSGATNRLFLDDGTTMLSLVHGLTPGSADAEITNLYTHLAVVTDTSNAVTTVNLGGANGGTDHDVTLAFASDASLAWGETPAAFVFTIPGSGGNFDIDINGSNTVRFTATGTLFASVTTGSAANLFQNASGSGIARSTSSLRYKDAVRDVLDDSLIDRLRPILFRSKCEGDDQTIDRYGFGAEEVHALGAPGLVHYIEDKGRQIPDGVQYQSIIPLLVARVQKLTARVETLEGAKG